jgi:hypothetical protein
MSLSERLAEYVRACFTGIWIESREHDDALVEIAGLCRQENWRLMTWDIAQGLSVQDQAGVMGQETAGADPLAAIRSLGALGATDGAALLVLSNFHRFLNSAEIIQALARQIAAGKQNRTFVIVLSPVIQLPSELEKLFVTIEHDLPCRAQLEQIARGVATEAGELPADEELSDVLDSAAGLTRYEAEGAFSLSLVRHAKVTSQAIWELKSQMLKKSGLLSLHRGGEKFTSLGGMESLKSFCEQALRRRTGRDLLARPRGVALVSPPGCGKSAFCKSLGNETGRPTLTLDVGSLMGSLVGQSEEQTRRALRIADAMAPAILFVDEIEKGLAGVAGSGQSDGGVSARMFGTLLTYLNDHETDVFVVVTANDISKLPPELFRSERFDAVFMIDLPNAEQKRQIWGMYLEIFHLDCRQPLPKDELWTGAEIRCCCRLAALLDVPLLKAAQNVVPVATTAAESVERLRNWANGRCLSANQPGLYRHDGSSSNRPSCRVGPDSSNN